MKHSIHAPAFASYTRSHGTLIPLHKWDDTSAHNGTIRKDGKRPIHNDWTKRSYPNAARVIELCVRDKRNIGVRLPADVVVIDIDPRNGGDEGWDNLTLELGLDETIFPCVITGSGGRHYYARKPADVPVVDTLKDFPGVEFKSKGRQVVAAGSIHPETIKHYRWDDNAPAPADMPELPANLLRMITRPQRTSVTSGGQLDQEQAEAVLSKLDPENFRDHDKWLKLMMSMHHATLGDARQEFVDWCISDPAYSTQAEQIGRRWDSLHTSKDGDAIVTIGTLRHFLSEAKALDVLPPDTEQAAADFEGEDDPDFDMSEPTTPATKSKKKKKSNPVLPADDGDDDDGVKPENEGGYLPEALGALAQLNAKYVCTLEDGFTIITQKSDPAMNRKYWQRIPAQAFEKFYSNKRIERDTSNLAKGASPTVPLGRAWIEWEGRNTVEGTKFAPNRDVPGYLNLWTGWAYEAGVKGDWSALKEMTFVCLCNRDQGLYDYVINWLAYMFQHPDEHAESAILFKGKQGIGKGTLGKAITRLVGQHAIHIASPTLLTGRFNAHFEDCVFLFADEAVKPYDKAAESQLKALITEEQLPIEAKGRDMKMEPNRIHLMMASNEDWVVQADEGNRRFTVCEATEEWQGQTAKWEALNDQLRNGGLNRMLFDMMNHKFPPGFHPRKPYHTDGMAKQMIASFKPVQLFLYNAAYDGIWPVQCIEGFGNWHAGPIRFFYEDMKNTFSGWQKHNNINPGNGGRANTHFLSGHMRDVHNTVKTDLRMKPADDSLVAPSPSDGRAQVVEMPSLARCRGDFEKMFKVRSYPWPAVSDDDDFG